jgi:uncharacterized protein
MERAENNDETRAWKDHISLQYKYTAGVAGDRFLQLLKQGKIQASVCKSCGKSFVPPKIFCKDCFVQLDEWKDVPEESAYVYSFTTIRNKDGAREKIVLVKFNGFEGGLLGKFKPSGEEDPKVGMSVKPVFKPKDARRGQISDIAYFEKTSS